IVIVSRDAEDVAHVRNLHERIHEWREHGSGTEQNQGGEQEQNRDKRHEPPLLLLPEEQHKFFSQTPHQRYNLKASPHGWQNLKLVLTLCVSRASYGYEIIAAFARRNLAGPHFSRGWGARSENASPAAAFRRNGKAGRRNSGRH